MQPSQQQDAAGYSTMHNVELKRGLATARYGRKDQTRLLVTDSSQPCTTISEERVGTLGIDDLQVMKLFFVTKRTMNGSWIVASFPVLFAQVLAVRLLGNSHPSTVIAIV